MLFVSVCMVSSSKVSFRIYPESLFSAWVHLAVQAVTKGDDQQNEPSRDFPIIHIFGSDFWAPSPPHWLNPGEACGTHSPATQPHSPVTQPPFPATQPHSPPSLTLQLPSLPSQLPSLPSQLPSLAPQLTCPVPKPQLASPVPDLHSPVPEPQLASLT